MQFPLAPENITSSIGGQDMLITHYPFSFVSSGEDHVNISVYEGMLSEWFGHPVILFGSGKSAVSTFLKVRKFNRYKHKIQVAQYFPAPLLNVLTEFAFPTNFPETGDGVWLYHQYGFPQQVEPKTPVIIEDIAHSFFATQFTGRRNWHGDVAVFSLTKFFSLSGSSGGLVVRDDALADEIRGILSSALPDLPELRDWMRAVLSDAYQSYRQPVTHKNIFVGSAYELLKIFVTPDTGSFVGFPQDINEIYRIGERRQERIRHFREYFGGAETDNSLWKCSDSFLPFALPFFGNGGNLKRANCALEEAGIRAGIYNIDVNRNMYAPDYKPCLLLPCHQDISMEDFDKICYITKNNM